MTSKEVKLTIPRQKVGKEDVLLTTSEVQKRGGKDVTISPLDISGKRYGGGALAAHVFNNTTANTLLKDNAQRAIDDIKSELTAFYTAFKANNFSFSNYPFNLNTYNTFYEILSGFESAVIKSNYEWRVEQILDKWFALGNVNFYKELVVELCKQNAFSYIPFHLLVKLNYTTSPFTTFTLYNEMLVEMTDVDGIKKHTRIGTNSSKAEELKSFSTFETSSKINLTNKTISYKFSATSSEFNNGKLEIIENDYPLLTLKETEERAILGSAFRSSLNQLSVHVNSYWASSSSNKFKFITSFPGLLTGYSMLLDFTEIHHIPKTREAAAVYYFGNPVCELNKVKLGMAIGKLVILNNAYLPVAILPLLANREAVVGEFTNSSAEFKSTQLKINLTPIQYYKNKFERLSVKFPLEIDLNNKSLAETFYDTSYLQPLEYKIKFPTSFTSLYSVVEGFEIELGTLTNPNYGIQKIRFEK